MILKKIVPVILLFVSICVFGQYKYSGIVVDTDNNPIKSVQIYDQNGGLLAQTNASGNFIFSSKKEEVSLVFFFRKL